MWVVRLLRQMKMQHSSAKLNTSFSSLFFFGLLVDTRAPSKSSNKTESDGGSAWKLHFICVPVSALNPIIACHRNIIEENAISWRHRPFHWLIDNNHFLFPFFFINLLFFIVRRSSFPPPSSPSSHSTATYTPPPAPHVRLSARRKWKDKTKRVSSNHKLQDDTNQPKNWRLAVFS